METGLEQRVKALEDREAIRELCATYCFLVDDGSFDALVERCFTADALCDFRSTDGSLGPLVSRGTEELRIFFGQVVAGLLRGMAHTVHNLRIELEGDTARGDCYFELTAESAVDGEPLVGSGRYLDRYRRVDGTWRFAERQARIAYIAPLLEGWAKRRFSAALQGPGGA